MPKKKLVKTKKTKQIKKPSRAHVTGFRLYCIALVAVGSLGLNFTMPPASLAKPEIVQNQVVPITIQHAADPTHLKIGEIIDLPIEEHFVSETGMPTVSSENVSHFSNSARPGEAGNMILYGHNRWHILNRLHSVKLGEMISITDTDGKLYQYAVTAIETVETDNTTWLQPTDTSVVTIYTCTGWLDSLRLVVRGVLVS